MTNRERIDISIVVPVYKEESNIAPFLARIKPVLDSISPNWEILFCLDPSPDRTEELIREAGAQDRRIKLVLFSRRFGQPAAVMGGIAMCRGETCVVIDVDLQDPPELIRDLYAKYKEGFDVVYAKRRSRKGETLPKIFVSWLGYKVINRLGEVEIPRNTGDFRIISRRVIEELKGLSEGHGFLRGLVAYVGFPQAFVEYDRDPRLAGSGKYNRFLGSLKIGLNGLVSFGSRPLQLMSLAGMVTIGGSLLLGAWYIVQWLAGFEVLPTISSTSLVVAFFAGVQLLSLGLMGEYVGRIYDEVKRRPKYIVHRTCNMDDTDRPASGP
jgi:glycosyltransferase involved in cell wall biosynthesis